MNAYNRKPAAQAETHAQREGMATATPPRFPEAVQAPLPASVAPYNPSPNTYPPQHPGHGEDPILSKAWPYFWAEGMVLFTLGIGCLVSPALLGDNAFQEIIGGLMMMAGIIKAIRSYQSREIPGFLASLTAAVFALVVGILLTTYGNRTFFSGLLALRVFFIMQTVTNFIFAGQFSGYPYASGFKLVSFVAFLMLILTIFGTLKEDLLFPSICMGALLMLEGALIFGVSLGLQRMAKGLPYQYEGHQAGQHPAKSNNSYYGV